MKSRKRKKRVAMPGPSADVCLQPDVTMASTLAGSSLGPARGHPGLTGDRSAPAGLAEGHPEPSSLEITVPPVLNGAAAVVGNEV